MRSSLFLAVVLALGGVVAAVPVDAQAQSRRQVKQTAEGAMVLTGTIDIGTEGQVEGFVLDQREKVEGQLAGFVERSVQTWRFQPVLRDGRAVRARTTVNIRLGAKPGPEGDDLVTLQAATFGSPNPESSDEVRPLKLKPPAYPAAAYNRGGKGEVMLVLQIGRDGKVMDVVAEQVNMHVVGDETQMKALRRVLAQQSINAARRWTFIAPSTGEHQDDPHWTIRVPVRFSFGDDKADQYGQWTVYIPGPRERAPWRTGDQDEQDFGGLLKQGRVYMADVSQGPRLLTPLGG